MEHELIALEMATGLLAERPDDLIEMNYTDSRAAIEKARVPLQALGMYEQAKRAVDMADELRKRGDYEAASKVVYVTYRELMRRSGTDARYEKKYRGLSDEEAANVPKDTPEDLLDEVQPDAYSGRDCFRARAATSICRGGCFVPVASLDFDIGSESRGGCPPGLSWLCGINWWPRSAH